VSRKRDKDRIAKLIGELTEALCLDPGESCTFVLDGPDEEDGPATSDENWPMAWHGYGFEVTR
jgi:hypothetical protein